MDKGEIIPATTPVQAEPTGEGEVCTAKDAALLRRAVKERWPITMDQRLRVINAMVETAELADDERARTNAAKVLIEADKLNHAAETGTGMGGDVTVRVVYDSPKPSQ